MKSSIHSSATAGLRSVIFFAGLLVAQGALAQFSVLPAPLLPGPPRESRAEIEKEYRIDAARREFHDAQQDAQRGAV